MKKILVGLAVLLVGIALFFGGLFLGQASATDSQAGWMMGSGVQSARFIGEDGEPVECGYGNAAGMMGQGTGMMGNGTGMMGNGYGMMGQGTGMMGNGYGMMGQGTGMMGGVASGGLAGVDPLSIEDAETALAEYLASLGNDSLAVGEIMIFDNHAYAEIVDTSSDTGAFEVLVDPVTLNVYPEPGPNMMWNTEYGYMSGFGGSGMMGGMIGSTATKAEISVTGEEAITIAQQYLDTYLDGTTADETADAFPGYYTIHVLRDGETIGMLSVNAYSGQVFLHHWHGDFIEMAGEEHG